MLSAATVLMFWIQMNDLLERKQEYVSLEEKFATYEALLERGQICLEDGELVESEQCYRNAMEFLSGAEMQGTMLKMRLEGLLMDFAERSGVEDIFNNIRQIRGGARVDDNELMLQVRDGNKVIALVIAFFTQASGAESLTFPGLRRKISMNEL